MKGTGQFTGYLEMSEKDVEYYFGRPLQAKKRKLMVKKHVKATRQRKPRPGKPMNRGR